LKVEVTIRCNRCDAIESVVTEAWSQLRTSCGCDGPYRVVGRKTLPEHEQPASSGNNKGEAPADSTEESAPSEQRD
jgi:hypothetical protein